MSYKLDAVNDLLSAIGENAANSLENTSGNLDFALALKTVERIDSMVQEEGWNYNKETMTLIPDNEGFIYLPVNCLKIDTCGKDYFRRVVARGTRMYDKEKNTFQIGNSIEVEIILQLDFEELPAAARRYISMRAAQEFISATVGDSAQFSYSKQAVAEARNAMEQAEAEGADANILESNYQLSRRERGI